MVLIIPKWPINDSWWIPILFGWFLKIPKCSPNLDPWTPYVSLKYFKKYKKIMGTSLKHIIFTYMDCRKFVNFGKDGHRKMMKIRVIKSSKSWIRDQYLLKNMSGFLWIWYQYLYQNIKWHFLDIWKFEILKLCHIAT